MADRARLSASRVEGIIMRTLTAVAILCYISAVSAAPVQTFSGDIKIGDSAAGMDFDIDGDGTPDLNAG